MAPPKMRKSVCGYKRDSYAGKKTELNSSFEQIDCSLGSSHWGISSLVMSAHTSFDPSLNAGYPDITYGSLRKRLLHRFSATQLTNKHLFLGHGSFNLAERLIHKLLEPSKMLGVGPQFNEIPSEFVAAGGTYETVLLKAPDYGFPLDDFLSRIDGDTSVVYIDNPNNPLGSVLSLAQLDAIAAQAQRHGAVLIVDEAYGDFVDDGESAVHIVKKFNNVAVIRSFSKLLGLAAARVGYMFLSEGLADAYAELSVPFEPTLYSARLAEATLDDAGFLADVRSRVTVSKRRISKTLKECGFTVLPTHESTSIMTVKLDGRDATEAFASIGIAVEPGPACIHTHPGWNESYCRIRIPADAFCDEFDRRVQQLKQKVLECS